MKNEIISKYKKEELNKLAPSNWKRTGFEFVPRAKYTSKAKSKVEIEGSIEYRAIEMEDIANDTRVGIDTYTKLLNETYFNSGYYLDIKGKNFRVKFTYSKENKDIIDYNYLNIADDAQGNILFDYRTAEDLRAVRNSVFLLKVGERADVNIIFVQRTSLDTDSFSSAVVDAARDSHVKEYFIELGGQVASNSNRVYIGESAKSETYSIYLADGERVVDLEYSVFHKGRRSESTIEGRGIVKDRAKKVFRGNLKFEQGSTKSKGREEEYALLLDKTVKADSIPTLLCDEDDVIGEHAASAGSIDQNKLFYLTSRGLNQKEAEKLVIMSSFKPILEKIGDKELEEAVAEEIERRV